MSAENRVFLVCRSKMCAEAKKYRHRCTLSVPKTAIHDISEDNAAEKLNRMPFCALYPGSGNLALLRNIPHWCVSHQNLSERKRKEKARKEHDAMYNDPEFLEIV